MRVRNLPYPSFVLHEQQYKHKHTSNQRMTNLDAECSTVLDMASEVVMQAVPEGSDWIRGFA